MRLDMENDIDFLTIDEFANKLNIHSNTVRRCIKKGKIQAIDMGNGKKKTYRIPKSEIQRLALFDLRKVIEMIKEGEI
jgi:excisionase family DNA binding protein